MKTWIYRHYKWKLYELKYIWINTETLDKEVIYKQLYDSINFPIWTVWVRPYEMFFENIRINWKVSPRFEFIWNKKYNDI